MGFLSKLFSQRRRVAAGENRHTQAKKTESKEAVQKDIHETTGKQQVTETIWVSRSDALSRIVELHRDKNVKSASLTDGGQLLARVHPGMADSDLQYVLMSADFYLSQCASRIQIVIERQDPQKESIPGPNMASQNIAQSDGYGFTPPNPILCGHGPFGEKKYLNRLRCPSGTPVRFERLHSLPVTDLMYLERAGLRLSPELESLSKSQNMPACVMLDCYNIACGCSAHGNRIYMDMYHIGPDRPLGDPGWSLEP